MMIVLAEIGDGFPCYAPHCTARVLKGRPGLFGWHVDCVQARC